MPRACSLRARKARRRRYLRALHLGKGLRNGQLRRRSFGLGARCRWRRECRYRCDDRCRTSNRDGRGLWSTGRSFRLARVARGEQYADRDGDHGRRVRRGPEQHSIFSIECVRAADPLCSAPRAPPELRQLFERQLGDIDDRAPAVRAAEAACDTGKSRRIDRTRLPEQAVDHVETPRHTTHSSIWSQPDDARRCRRRILRIPAREGEVVFISS
jgi:hypothetical protein